MKKTEYPKSTQYSFWGNVDYVDDKSALDARNTVAKSYKARGYKVECWTLARQVRKYLHGKKDGTMGNMYFCEVESGE